MFKVKKDGDCFYHCIVHFFGKTVANFRKISKQPKAEANEVAMTRVAHNLNICIHVYPVELTDFAKRVQMNNAIVLNDKGTAEQQHIHVLNWTYEGTGFHFDVLEDTVEGARFQPETDTPMDPGRAGISPKPINTDNRDKQFFLVEKYEKSKDSLRVEKVGTFEADSEPEKK